MTKIDDRVVFHGQIVGLVVAATVQRVNNLPKVGQTVGLVVAATLIRQLTCSHGPVKLRRLEVGPYRKQIVRVMVATGRIAAATDQSIVFAS